MFITLLILFKTPVTFYFTVINIALKFLLMKTHHDICICQQVSRNTQTSSKNKTQILVQRFIIVLNILFLLLSFRFFQGCLFLLKSVCYIYLLDTLRCFNQFPFLTALFFCNTISVHSECCRHKPKKSLFKKRSRRNMAKLKFTDHNLSLLLSLQFYKYETNEKKLKECI